MTGCPSARLAPARPCGRDLRERIPRPPSLRWWPLWARVVTPRSRCDLQCTGSSRPPTALHSVAVTRLLPRFRLPPHRLEPRQISMEICLSHRIDARPRCQLGVARVNELLEVLSSPYCCSRSPAQRLFPVRRRSPRDRMPQRSPTSNTTDHRGCGRSTALARSRRLFVLHHTITDRVTVVLIWPHPSALSCARPLTAWWLSGASSSTDR